MWEKFRAIFTIPELRQKIFFTLILLAVFRVGYQIPLPVVDQEKLATSLSKNQSSPFYQMMNNVSVLSAFIGSMNFAGASGVRLLLAFGAALSVAFTR